MLKNLIEEKNIIMSHILNMIMAVYVFFIPFSKAFTFSTGPYVLLFFWLLEGDLKKKIVELKKPPFIFLSLFLIWASASLLWSDDKYYGIKFIHFICVMFIVLVIFYTSIEEKYRKFILYSFLVSIFLNEILVYFIYFGFIKVTWASPDNPHPYHVHHILYSIILAITLLLLLNQILNRSTSLFIKFLEAIFFTTAAVNLFINIGRTGQVAFIAALMIFTFFYSKKGYKYITFTLISIAVLYILAYNLSPNFRHRVILAIDDIHKIEKGDYDTSLGGRYAVQYLTLTAIKEKPVIGHGSGNFKPTIAEVGINHQKYFDVAKYISSTHNDFLQITLFYGLIGLLLYLAFFFTTLRYAPQDKLNRATFYAIMTIFITAGFANMNFKYQYPALMGFLIAFFLSLDKHKFEKKRNSNIQVKKCLKI